MSVGMPGGVHEETFPEGRKKASLIVGFNAGLSAHLPLHVHVGVHVQNNTGASSGCRMVEVTRLIRLVFSGCDFLFVLKQEGQFNLGASTRPPPTDFSTLLLATVLCFSLQWNFCPEGEILKSPKAAPSPFLCLFVCHLSIFDLHPSPMMKQWWRMRI